MAKASIKIDEAYQRKAERERWEQAQKEQQEKKKQRQTKLAALSEKKAKGRLTLEDIDEKLDVIIEMLQDLMPPK